MSAPSLREREQPGLSETLTGQRDPHHCLSCSTSHTAKNPLGRWLEHDAWDRVPAHPAVVVLCRRCSDRLIEPHARLYRALWPGEPFPGCMSICTGCALRDGTSCTSPLAKVNGGPGIAIGWADGKKPTVCHIDGVRGGKRYGETTWIYPGPVTSCSAREVHT